MKKIVLSVVMKESVISRLIAVSLRRRFFVHVCDVDEPQWKKSLAVVRPDAAVVDLSVLSPADRREVSRLLHNRLKAVVIEVSGLSKRRCRPYDKRAFFFEGPTSLARLPEELAAVVLDGIELTEMFRGKRKSPVYKLLSLLHNGEADVDADDIIYRFTSRGVPEKWIVDRLYGRRDPLALPEDNEDDFGPVQSAQPASTFLKEREESAKINGPIL